MSRVPKILVIDDEIDLRENLKYVLQMNGYEVELAEDGVKGLEVLENFKPDLILLDLNMPNMGGIVFYQTICVDDRPLYPVFVLTARVNMEKLFKDFNVDGFMSKPFDIKDLIQEIGYVINNRSAKAPEGSSTRRIFIAEDDEIFSGKVGAALLTKGLTVNLARSGAEAIERISKDIPDIVCIKMNLPDIAGDIVIQKLKRMAKTSAIKAILYTFDIGDNIQITNKIESKQGIDRFVTVDSEKALMEAINEFLQ